MVALNIYTQKDTLIKTLDADSPKTTNDDDNNDEKDTEIDEESSNQDSQEEEESFTVHNANGTFFVNTSAANIRNGNNTSFNIIGTVQLNQEINVKGKTDNGWYMFEHNGNDAFISGTLL
ncbi:SH3 domain-containing protein, partial [Pseudomonas sp. 2995-3]|uniref:SH3 domain-containing protein n=1 Tax=Pseudomonas sp. 2995-3 TaxID=1712680 RepID=UPI000C6A8573